MPTKKKVKDLIKTLQQIENLEISEDYINDVVYEILRSKIEYRVVKDKKGYIVRTYVPYITKSGKIVWKLYCIQQNLSRYKTPEEAKKQFGFKASDDVKTGSLHNKRVKDLK